MVLLGAASAVIRLAASSGVTMGLGFLVLLACYQALLCLAQVATPDPQAPDGVRTEVIDPLADDPPDPAPLARVLANPEVEVVVHAGRQDIAILRRTWATDVTCVFDTQLAAGFLGFGNQEGYESLVRKVLGVRQASVSSFFASPAIGDCGDVLIAGSPGNRPAVGHHWNAKAP